MPPTRTVLNESYKGLVESMAIPATLHPRPDGSQYASFGSVRPIHCCTTEEVEQYRETTHHYCDVFSEETLAPLGELAYVRLDDTTAEKVFINRHKRVLITSSDGRLAQWRAAPTFESLNRFVPGAPVVDGSGALVSVVTARRGNHYAVSNVVGEGGYFDTPTPWQQLSPPPNSLLYGRESFPSRTALVSHVSRLPPAHLSRECPAAPLLLHSATSRVALVADNGRQVAHLYLPGILSDQVEYL